MATDSTLTVKASANGQVVTDDTLNPQTLKLDNPTFSKKFTNGAGAGLLNKECAVQLVIPASGADTINLATGAVTGSETKTLKTPDGTTLALTGLKVFHAILVASGADSVTVNVGAGTDSFTGWGGGATKLGELVGDGGATVLQCRTDAAGWVIDGTHKNIVIQNHDGDSTATVNLVLAGI